ncbi:MAG: transketolase family protein [Candidatus Omnitrophica bacterium]|nr:transketolase family protein [Candidatus Omnitrophota bacterium]MBU1133672.1 transketolase family protein [Candidatus Omnitrophota bacterium]MBU1366841.1 transketolase family protein [Candidatus Omnitrophota bacterium]MBU1524285.1 transketolase family protein [Candidatus Omnitrophota bacterium]MBU2436919.1 transketolase family protein [Candidatus Omnitrophota bacterium]
MEKLYTRDIYGKTLVDLGKQDSEIVVLDADLSGSTRTSFFRKEFPERFFNLGVAEQNMMAVSAGLASCGKIVFVSTFAMFATIRALDQVRNTICYNNLNVKIVASHGGITVGEDGASHQALEDVNFLRAIPNVKIVVPCDAEETKNAVIAAYKTDGPFYIRLGRSKVPTIDKKKDFVLGKGYIVEEGRDLAIISCGIMVYESLVALNFLKEKGYSACVVNMPTIKPIDENLIVELGKKYKKILVCEEHQVRGGLYSAVCEVLGRRCPVNLDCVGIKDEFGQSGSPSELMEFYELSSRFIARKAESLLRQQD